LGSIRTLKISGLIFVRSYFPPPPNFQRGNLLYKLVSSTNLVETEEKIEFTISLLIRILAKYHSSRKSEKQFKNITHFTNIYNTYNREQRMLVQYVTIDTSITQSIRYQYSLPAMVHIRCSFKCILTVGVEVSIVNGPRITDNNLRISNALITHGI
jgi:hypothetical protein